MILDDKTIKQLDLIKENFNEDNLQPASYDLTLESAEAIDKIYFFGPEDKALLSSHEENGNWIIETLEGILVTTKEYIELPDNIAATLKDKSSFTRLGVSINQGWIDPGFKGTLTVLAYNLSNKSIKIPKGETFCQIVFEEVKQSVQNSYNGHYQDQRGITKSILDQSDEEVGLIYGEVSD